MKKTLLFVLILLLFSNLVSGQTNGQLTVGFKTTTYNGAEAPKHILAVWVTKADGTFVKTLMAYTVTTKYRQYLTKWKSATNSTYNMVDAVTGATLTSHGTRSCTWDCTDVAKVVQPDGDYRINVEFTEASAAGKIATISFTKNATPASTFTTITSSTNVSSISVVWSPVNTAVDNIDYEKYYKIYPNPVSSVLFVTGSDIREVSLYDMQGKNILNITENQLDFSQYKPGNYLIKIRSDKGIVMRTAIKK
jgi:hypothetical protein